jgi:hypothetical protein
MRVCGMRLQSMRPLGRLAAVRWCRVPAGYRGESPTGGEGDSVVVEGHDDRRVDDDAIDDVKSGDSDGLVDDS